MRAVSARHHAQPARSNHGPDTPLPGTLWLPIPAWSAAPSAASAVSTPTAGIRTNCWLIPVHHHRNRARQRQPGKRAAKAAIAALVMAAIALPAPAAPGFEGTHRMTPQPISTLGATMDQAPETTQPNDLCHGCSKPLHITAVACPQCGAPQRQGRASPPNTAAARENKVTAGILGPCCWAASASIRSTPAHGAGASSTSCCASPTSLPWWRWSRGIRYLTLKQPEFAQRPRVWTDRCLLYW